MLLPSASVWLNTVRLIGLSWLILLTACADSPQESIAQTMQRREQGLNRKDIGLYISAFSTAYDDGEKTYAGIKAEAEENFKAFDRLEYQTLARSIYMEGNQGRVVQKYILTFQTPNGKKSAKGEEAFLVKNEPQGWKITGKPAQSKS